MTVSVTNSVATSVPERQDAQHIIVRTDLDPDGNQLIRNLTPGRHTPLELVYAVRNSFDHMGRIGNVLGAPFEMRVATRVARLFNIPAEFRSLFQSRPFLRQVRRLANWEIDLCVQRAFELFDEYFFFDQLGRYTRVELVPGLLRSGCFGCTGGDPSRGEPYVLIKLDYQGADGSGLAPEAKAANMKNVLGVLLHEMVHASFQIFRCKCSQCRRDKPYMVGHRGHGFAWIELANVVQRVAREQFDCVLDLHCGEDRPGVSEFLDDLNMR